MRTPLLVIALVLAACGGGSSAPDAAGDTLYAHLGGASGMHAIVADWIARAYADEKINGYFANTSVDQSHMVDCMTDELAVAAGGPAKTETPPCQSDAAAHAGMHVSRQDQTDMVAHLSEALDAAGVAAADKSALLALAGAHDTDIVSDESNDGTIYQRLGRKPGIAGAVTAFEDVVKADVRVNGFFATIQNYTRIHNCLTRQLCSLDGPCKYGEELATEFPGLTNQTGCRPMAAAHYGLHDQATPTPNPITIDDFNAIVEDLDTTLTNAQVAQADITAINGILGPLCSTIVAGGTGCP